MTELDTQLGPDVVAKLKYPDYHGSPYDRGAADSYYRRPFNPHYFGGEQGGPFGGTVRIELADMTPEEIAAYAAGYRDNDEAGDHKEW